MLTRLCKWPDTKYVSECLHNLHFRYPEKEKSRLRGFAKLKNSKKNLDRPHTTYPPTPHPSQTFFFDMQNTQIIITNNFYQCIYRQNTIIWYTTQKYQYWFRAILG